MIIDNIDPKTVRGSVGLMLREERLARGLSFEQAADSARIPARYLHRLERGKGYYFVFFEASAGALRQTGQHRAR